MNRTFKTAALVCAASALAAAAAFSLPLEEKLAQPAASATKSEEKTSKMTKTPSGLQYEDTVVGTGASPKTGQTCVMHYTGWLWESEQKGKKFDSSVDRGQPFEFQIGRGDGDQGLGRGRRDDEGGRQAHAPHPGLLGYGSRGAGEASSRRTRRSCSTSSSSG